MKEIKCRNGEVVLVDDEDYELLSKFRWRLSTRGYPYAHVAMHRFIIKPPHDKEIDHIDHNPLNNQKLNLRICTSAQNKMNRRKGLHGSNKHNTYKGVRIERNRWAARIKNKLIGRFDTAEEAAKVYDFYAKLLYGEFAYLNFPEEQITEVKKSPRKRKGNNSNYLGVHKPKGRSKWVARFSKGEYDIYIGGKFETEIEAAKAHDKVAYEILGDKAQLNFPEDFNHA